MPEVVTGRGAAALDLLHIEGLRCIESAQLQAHAQVNVLVGGNGAGKTSVLEGIHCLATGRSFRAGQSEHLIRKGADRLRVTARLLFGGRARRLGFERDRDGWRGRVDGVEMSTLGELASCLGVLCFEPESHALIAGPGEGRRRLVDLALFHVEPEYLAVWRSYQRALKQRNAALRMRATAAVYSAWDPVLVESGEQLAALRSAWIDRLVPYFEHAIAEFLPDFAATARLRWRTGWDDSVALGELLTACGERDRELGYTVAGPHRGDLKVQLREGLGRYEFSRGQQKLVALALTLATAAAMTDRLGWSPILLLDDLPSELDPQRLALCLAYLRELGSQLWLTATQWPDALSELGPGGCAGFAVAEGRVVPLQRA